MTAIAGCALDNQGIPSLTGPSELGLSLAISATPDILTQDGQSQATVRVVARGPNGQPLDKVSIRLDLRVNGQVVDFGTLSSKNATTAADGIATVTYTAPPTPPVGASEVLLEVLMTPVGELGSNSNYANATTRSVMIRLTPPGIIQPPNGTPVPRFIASPTGPRAGDPVFFDASTSTDSDGQIVDYSWNFGDGSTGGGVLTEHDYELAGTYNVTLTVTDDRGLKATSAPKEITVASSDAPTAEFTVSPESPAVGDLVSVNASLSTAAVGHTIVSWEWDFGDGSALVSSGGPQANHTYSTAGSFTIVLRITDNFGLTHAVAKSVTITP